MILHRLLRDGQSVRDFLVGHSLGNVVEDLDLAWRERREDVGRARAVHRQLAELGEHLRRDRGSVEDLLVDDELARSDLADRVDELGGLAVLVKVGRGARSDGFEEDLLLVLCGQDDDADGRKLPPNALRRLDAG